MLNAGYDFRRNNAGLLVNPEQASAGWKNLGKGLQVAAGIMSWKDKQKQAKRINDAQDKYYDALIKYLNGDRQSEPEKPIEVSVAEEVQETTPLEEQINEDVIKNMNAPTQVAVQTGGQSAYDAYQKALENIKKQKALEAMQATNGAGMANALMGAFGG